MLPALNFKANVSVCSSSNALLLLLLLFISGPDSSVGIATDYGLEVPGWNSGGDEIFLPSRPALGPSQPPIQLVPGLSRGLIAAGACC